MGWLFTDGQSRKDLIRHLTTGNGIKTLKHCTVGNNLWCVHEYPHPNNRVVRFVALYKMAKHTSGGCVGWGYKDIDETMGPYDTSCPESYLTMCTAPENLYAYNWRQRVYAIAEQKRRLKIGTKWKYGNKVYEILKRLSPTAFRVKDQWGDTWRVRTNQLLNAEML